MDRHVFNEVHIIATFSLLTVWLCDKLYNQHAASTTEGLLAVLEAHFVDVPAVATPASKDSMSLSADYRRLINVTSVSSLEAQLGDLSSLKFDGDRASLAAELQ